uniref:Uncharacterized protein n=1 Tax=Arundo donax TaxID=35708 RepID=A0A0A8ZRY1_ARUDO
MYVEYAVASFSSSSASTSFVFSLHPCIHVSDRIRFLSSHATACMFAQTLNFDRRGGSTCFT